MIYAHISQNESDINRCSNCGAKEGEMHILSSCKGFDAQAAAISEGDAKPSAMEVQVGGDHYKELAIQPIEYIHRNGIGFAEGCAIKYLTRWRAKGGIKDLEKARHFIDLLIEMEAKK